MGKETWIRKPPGSRHPLPIGGDSEFQSRQSSLVQGAFFRVKAGRPLTELFRNLRQDALPLGWIA